MGRPTKYTSSVGSSNVTSRTAQINAEISVTPTSNSSSRSSTSRAGYMITPWYQVSNLKSLSLLHRQLLVQRHSLHAADAVNPWLVMSADVSLSPDSTVKELEQSPSDNEDITKPQREAVNLCQKSAASFVALKLCHNSGATLDMPASISTSSIAVSGKPTVNCCESLQTHAARHWLNCNDTLPTDAHNDLRTRHTSEPVLNLSVKPLQAHRHKSSSHRTTAVMLHNDDDCSGCVLLCIIC